MTTASKTAFVDRSAYLGDPSQGDPTPVFRDEASDAETWPEGAAFKVVFMETGCRFSYILEIRKLLPATEFYGADGWPVDFPADKKHLHVYIKEELQVCPSGWRQWTEWAWNRLEECASYCLRIPRAMGEGRPSRSLTALFEVSKHSLTPSP